MSRRIGSVSCAGSSPPSELWAFDEVHKYRGWRNYLKGLYDGRPPGTRILVTGSARLEAYRFGGDSLQGRYHFLRLHPLSVAELGLATSADLRDLLALGGFPEPWFGATLIEARRWARDYRTLLIREEVVSLERVQDLGSLELLMLRLPELVGSPLSVNALREDLQFNHKSVSAWLRVFERLYAIFRLPPFGAPRLRAVKKEQKHYHLDWSLVPDESARFENLVACHLLKWVHHRQDTQGLDVELRYFRDTDGREVDFLVVDRGRPMLCVECKWSDAPVDKSLRYFKARFPDCDAWQVSAVGTKDYVTDRGIRVAPALTLLGTLVRGPSPVAPRRDGRPAHRAHCGMLGTCNPGDSRTSAVSNRRTTAHLPMHTLRAFLLTRHWRDASNGLELSLWAASEQGPLRIVLDREEAVCFLERASAPENDTLANAPYRRRPLDLATLEGAPVDGLYFRRQRDLVETRDLLRGRGIAAFESDLKPADRYLMERFVTAGFAARGETVQRPGHLEMRNPALRRDDFHTTLRWVSLDIETAGLDGALYSVALHSPDDERVLMVSEDPVRCEDVPVESFPNESILLSRLFAWFAEHDPDLVLGWNVVGFDLDFIARRCRRLGVAFDIARGGERSAILQPGSASGTYVARIPGRVVLDGIDTLRTAFWSFESFELEHVAREMLGKGKRIDHAGDRVGEIIRLYEQDRTRLAAYNIEDCRLVAAIVEKAGLIEFSMRRAELTGLGMERQGGSVAAFDNLYLPRLHRAGRVAPDVADARSGEGSPGGYILDSKPGLYDNVLVLDFKSLYPSIIRTFGIDPYALHAPGEDRIEGFQGGTFAREGAILPGLVRSVWEERDRAKQRGDAAMSQATKILMNSFYGILGATGCRFHDSRLASSITRRGHEIIRRTRDAIEEGGESVIYGDTDSLFVLLGEGVGEATARGRGSAIAAKLNDWWRRAVAREHRLESFLEIEFETHFLKFLMPTVRGEATGSKKRYAGMVRSGDGGHDFVFKGLESVRTDWTPLARAFQRELYRRVFLGEPFEAWVRDTLEAMLAGEHDEALVYRKRLRQSVEQYTRNVPPHVQAARKLGRKVRWVRYVITTSGPEPVEDGRPVPRPDYDHYRERQLAPAADGLLHFLDTSFDAITDRQMAIF